MQAKKTIGGREVIFTTKLQTGASDFQKIIDVRVAGGGFGPSDNWLSAWQQALEYVALADESEARRSESAAKREAGRLARIAKHQAKKARRAEAQSLRARLANLERAQRVGNA